MLNRKSRRGRHRYNGQPGAIRLREPLGRLADEAPPLTPATYTPPAYDPPVFDAPQPARGRLK